MIYGCIGEHLPHSFSKIIHEKIENYDYILKELTKDEVAPFILGKDFSGINVTIPYKETVIPYLDAIDDAARAIGAVNTVVNHNGKLYGYNTDFAGLKALIEKTGLSLDRKKVLIIGTGGTAKTAHAVAESMKARATVHITQSGKNNASTYSEAYLLHSDAEIVINTSPCGMFPNIHTFPADADGKPFSFDAFPSLEGAIDVVYNPLRTRFVSEARKRGLVAEGGLYMLVAQAVFAAQYFTGKTYPRKLIEDIYGALVAEKENIVLIGMPGSGKSTLSALLSQKLGYPAIDTDAMIVDTIGMPIGDYFKKYGEEAFRRVESEVIREIAGLTHTVIATGGGAILKEENVTALKQNGRLYFLDRSLDSLLPTSDRPLAQDKDAIQKRYEERYDIYTATSDEIVKHFESPEGTANEIAARHQNRQGYDMKILVINGPNINMLGIREPDIYGKENYKNLLETIRAHAEKKGIDVECYQSNHEGALVDKIQEAFGKTDGIVINPGAYTHTSIALLDAVKAVGIPTVEVHISKVEEREDFRQISYIRKACIATVTGKGIAGYLEAIDILTQQKD